MGKRYLSLYLILLLLILAVRGNAQELRYWSEGPLTVSDISVVDEPADTVIASFVWNHKKKRVNKGRVRFVYNDYNSAFYKEGLMVGRNRISENVVDSLQRLFNLSEYYTRIVRNKVLANPLIAKESVKKYAREFRTARDSNLIASFTLSDDFDISSKQLERTIGFSLSAGAFAILPFGDMTDLVRLFYGYTVGVGISYDRFFIQSELSNGEGRYLGTYTNIHGADATAKVPSISIQVYLGYYFKESSDYRLAFFAGGVRNEYGFFDSDSFSVGSYGLAEGIRIDWRAHTDNLFTIPFVRIVEYSPYLMLSSSQQWISNNNTISPSFSLTVGLSLDVHAARIR